MTERAAGPGAEPHAAIVVAGGRGSRLGGVDKRGLVLDGLTLLDRALAALTAAGVAPVVVVGPEVGGGPAAAIASALPRLDAAWAFVLAVDLVRPARVLALLGSAAASGGPGADGTVLLGPDGHEQWLAARYRLAALRDAFALLGEPAGASMRRVVGGLDLAHLPAPAETIADIDTWEDYETAGGEPHG